MKFNLVGWLLALGAGLVGLGTLAALLFVVAAIATGQSAQTTLAVALDGGTAYRIVAAGAPTVVGSLVADHATLSVRAGGLGYRLAQGLDVLLTGGLWITVLNTLRGLTDRIALGRAFDGDNVKRLRVIGWSLIGLGIWAWARATLLPLLLLPHIAVEGGQIALLPTFSLGITGMHNARIDARLDIMLPVIGVLILVLAEAFRTGIALREENEAIV